MDLLNIFYSTARDSTDMADFVVIQLVSKSLGGAQGLLFFLQPARACL